MPGPIDRVHFLDEQRRSRRASGKFSLFAAVAAIVSGLPLSALLAPPLFGLALLAVQLVDWVRPVPPELWDSLESVARSLPDLWTWARGDGPAPPWLLLTAVLAVPGSAVMLGAWLWIRVVFRQVGVGGLLRRLGVRDPNRTVLREAQLVNSVEEIAIAAGVQPPRVLIVDSKAANAAAVGLTIDDAALVVSRGLLKLDRDERQAILAHLIGSVANGDLRIAGAVLSVLQTWGLLALLLETPFGPRSRAAVRDFISISARAWRSPADREAAATMLDGLLDGAALRFNDLDEHTEIENLMARPLVRQLLVDLPLYLTLAVGAIAARAAIALFTTLVFGPWVARMWRARRRLADATAVRLTRHPDALARAVREMEGRNVAVEGGAAVSFLFPFWTRFSPDVETGEEIMEHMLGTQLALNERLASLRQLGAADEAQPTGADAEGTTWRDALLFAGWGLVACALVAACVAVTLLTTSLVIWGIWWLLSALPGGP